MNSLFSQYLLNTEVEEAVAVCDGFSSKRSSIVVSTDYASTPWELDWHLPR